MKNLFTILLLICSVAIAQSVQGNIKPSNPFLLEERNTAVNQAKSAQTSEFEQGFYDGYEEGWKNIKGANARSPRPPRAPMPERDKQLYKHGYIKGYVVGQGDAIKGRYNR